MIDLNSIEDIESNENWFSMPSESNWYGAMQFVEKNLQDANKKIANSIINKIKAVVYVLINDGNTYESIVLKTAILYLYAKSTGVNVSSMEKEFDKYTLDGVKAMLDFENPEYIKNVFEDNNISTSLYSISNMIEKISDVDSKFNIINEIVKNSPCSNGCLLRYFTVFML